MVRAVQFLVQLVVFAAVADAANVFNMPAGQTSLEFVTVGDPGNAPDTRYLNTYTSRPNLMLGSVPYTYQMGKYDVTLAQYVVFLNAVAKSDPYRLVDGTGITRNGLSGSYTYSVPLQYENLPVSGVIWYNAARFVNWLHNGQPNGPQGPTTTESGVYDLFTVGPFTINGNEVTRNATATYFIPTEDEWYKAAYYKGGGQIQAIGLMLHKVIWFRAMSFRPLERIMQIIHHLFLNHPLVISLLEHLPVHQVTMVLLIKLVMGQIGRKHTIPQVSGGLYEMVIQAISLIE